LEPHAVDKEEVVLGIALRAGAVDADPRRMARALVCLAPAHSVRVHVLVCVYVNVLGPHP
jgi:hypothetical protein